MRNADRPAFGIVGRRVLGIGVAALALVAVASGDFLPGQPVSKTVPARLGFAAAAALVMFAGSVALQWRRTAAAGGALLTIYFGLVVVLVMNGPVVLAHRSEFGAYSGAAEQLAIAAGASIVYGLAAPLDGPTARRAVRIGQTVFGICAVLFGIAHFVYMDLTAPLVPRWLPPSQEFWARATGVAQIAAGIAIAVAWRTRLAAGALTVLYGCFALFVHAPMLASDPGNRYDWSENALNFALLGVAWVVAESGTAARRR